MPAAVIMRYTVDKDVIIHVSYTIILIIEI
jgi:hypothetical protein